MFRISQIPGLALIALVAIACIPEKQTGDADLVDLTRRADLVFRGTVLNVGYRNSEPPMVFPHTFVQFQVDEVLKGKDPGPTLTLRFAGGWDGGERMARLGSHTLFDVGDRDVLFVTRHLQWACPLVDCEGGRFRLIDGKVHDESGREIGRVGPRFVPGPQRDDLPSVMRNQVGPFQLDTVRSPAENEGSTGPILPAGWEQYEAPAFIERLHALIERNHTPAELEALPLVPSAAFHEPFSVPVPKAEPFASAAPDVVPAFPKEG